MTEEKPDALTKAAERWGMARIYYRQKKTDPTTTRMVATMKCLKCGRRVAWSRFRWHVLSHLKGTA